MKKLKYLIFITSFIILSFLLTANNSYADIVSNYPTISETINEWNSNWIDITNVVWNDTNNFAQVNMSNNPDNSNTLIVKWFNFKSFNIPVWATINWIKVDIEWNWSNDRITDSVIQLTKNGKDPYWNNLAKSSFQITKNISTYWSENNLWWTTWSDTEIKSDNFWVLIKYNKEKWWTRDAKIYRVKITIDFTNPEIESPLNFNIINENYWNNWFCYDFEAINNSTQDITDWEIWFNINWANIISNYWWNFTNLWWWEYSISSSWNIDTFPVWKKYTFWLCADSQVWYISNLTTKNYKNVWPLMPQEYNLENNWLNVNITNESSTSWSFCREIELVNNWNKTINWWILDFELDQNLSSNYWWNFSKNSITHTITPLSNNKIINPGETYTLWFCSEWTNLDNNWSIETLTWIPGFCWKYYEWTPENPFDIMNSKFSRADFEINFDWWTLSPSEELPNDNFTAKWEWKFQANESWEYNFRTKSDDWIRLYINNNIVIDQWLNQTQTEATWNINLDKWKIYNIRVEYYENSGTAMAELEWKEPGNEVFSRLDWNSIFHWACQWGVSTWLETIFNWWNWQAGNMFDIEILNNDLIIDALSINTNTQSSTLRVYYKQWSYSWFENSSAWWTLLWDFPFSWAWEWNPTYVEINPLTLNKNTNYSFYVTEVWTKWILYTQWTIEWNIFTQDNFIIFREWLWNSFEFKNNFSPRIWNGIIHYTAIIDKTPPAIEYQNIKNNDLLPNWDKQIIIDYFDNSWLDLSTINSSLSKWNWSDWWTNILNNHQINFSNEANQSIYNLSPLGYGKYKFNFNIDDNFWNSNSKDLIFYIDEPKFIISDSKINIWNISSNNKNNFSSDLLLVVQTVWAGFDIQMNKDWELSYSGYDITDWNWDNWFWYDWEPMTNTIKKINNNQLITSNTKNINTNWEKNTYIYTIKFWANIPENVAAWKYSWLIDFKIMFNY